MEKTKKRCNVQKNIFDGMRIQENKPRIYLQAVSSWALMKRNI